MVSRLYVAVKRLLDVVLAVVGLVVLSPALLAIALLIMLDSGGPVLFRQTRVGVHKKNFCILKFRTMRVDAPGDIPTHLLGAPELYVTTMGRFLRKTSLDELPQLVNILRGEMSFVGPRPALWNQDDLVSERDRHGANDIRPGLTGWAQVNGRDALSVTVKAMLDGEYVQRMSFSMDLMCILRTIGSVLHRDGV